MGELGPSSGPYYLSQSKKVATLGKCTNGSNCTGGLSNSMPSPTLLVFLRVGRASSSLVNWGEMARAGKETDWVPIPALTF